MAAAPVTPKSSCLSLSQFPSPFLSTAASVSPAVGQIDGYDVAHGLITGQLKEGQVTYVNGQKVVPPRFAYRFVSRPGERRMIYQCHNMIKGGFGGQNSGIYSQGKGRFYLKFLDAASYFVEEFAAHKALFEYYGEGHEYLVMAIAVGVFEVERCIITNATNRVSLNRVLSGVVGPKVNLLALNMFSALVAIHKLGWAHCDVKPANILVERDLAGRLKRFLLTDFGIATNKKPAEYAAKKQTRLYREIALELLWRLGRISKIAEFDDLYKQGDIWALAAVLLCVCQKSKSYKYIARTHRDSHIMELVVALGISRNQVIDLCSVRDITKLKRLQHPFPALGTPLPVPDKFQQQIDAVHTAGGLRLAQMVWNILRQPDPHKRGSAAAYLGLLQSGKKSAAGAAAAASSSRAKP